MEQKTLSEYEQVLYGCRFCPMCKPAAEVGSLTQLESHSTRGRALMLWRVAKDLAEFSPRDAQLLYQSTLDSISQAWCINHYPVAEYLAAARRELVAKGLVPSAVKEILLKKLRAESCPQGETVLLAGELSELEDKSAADPAVKLLEKCGERVEVFYTPTGALAYALGDIETAREQATEVAKALEQAGVKRVVADGPQTMYAIKVLYPLLGVSLPDKLVVVSLAALVEPALGKTKIASKLNSDQKVFFHDSRSACFLAEELASDEVIQPAFCDREEHSGSGEVYELPRRIIENLGLRRVSSVWSRSLSKSTGADDGLWLTYPVLAAGLAKMRLEHIQSLGADAVVTGSVLDAVHLRKIQMEGSKDLQVYWLPELFGT
jgi:Fe-S oxidoreductase